MQVAIVDVLGSPYDGSTPSKRGLGGSESAVVYIARELVKLGISVHIFNDCTNMDAMPGVYDGVEYHYEADPFTEYDVLISSRSIKPFSVFKAKKKILWMHDTFCDGDDQVESLLVNGHIDEIWTLSDWHTTYISQCTHGHRRMMEVLKRKIWVTRNGINIFYDVNFQKKDYNHFVFNASYSKGMKTLLEDIWPKVSALIPKAHLTIIGGAYPLKQKDQQATDLENMIAKYDGRNNVKFTGIISQKEVADVLRDASFMLYPQSFPETFGISTVESLAYGTPVISGRFGAMEETAIDDACYLMDYPVDSNALYTFNKEAHVNAFVNLTLEAYNNPYLWQQKSNAGLKVREVCAWNKVALQWKQHLFNITGRYFPVMEYKVVTQINHRIHKIFNKRWSNPEEWGYYPEIEKRIEVIVTFFNGNQYLNKCIESIISQNYSNYAINIIDDASTDGTEEIVDTRIDWWTRETNHGALANQVWVLNSAMAKSFGDDTIIILIDGDDALINDPNIFKRINQLYHEGAEFTYGSCWSMADNIPLVAQEYPADVIANKTFKEHKFPWNMPYTHLRTFSYSLFKSIDLNDLRDDDGNYYKAGGDAALFYALIEQASASGIKCVRDITYLYNDAHPNNDFKINSEEQTRNADRIMSQTKKKILIAIPTANNIHPETFKSIYDLIIPDGFEAHFQYFYGYCVDQVRNLIAHYTISNKFDYLFAVDYDISFEPDTLIKLLQVNVAVMSGLYIQRKPDQHVLEIYRTDRNTGHQYNVPLSELKKDGRVSKIDGCGFGCALVRRDAFERVGYPYFTYHHAITIEDTISEDVDFCNKLRATGLEVWCHNEVKCKHHGQSVFEV